MSSQLIAQMNDARLALHARAHRIAFSHYMRWGSVPEALTSMLEETSSMKAFLEALADFAYKYNFDPNQPRVPSGNSDGGQWTSGGGHGQSYPDNPHGYSALPPDEPGLGHSYGIEIAFTLLFVGRTLLRRTPLGAVIALGEPLFGRVVSRVFGGTAAGLDAAATTARLESTLAPGGRLIGEAGSDPTIRELPGGRSAAEKMFQQLSKGGTVTTPDKLAEEGGVVYRMPDGSHLTYRPISSDNGPPTINVTVSSLKGKIRKLKFLEGE